MIAHATSWSARRAPGSWRPSLVALEGVAGVTVDGQRDGLVIQTLHARQLAVELPRVARERDVRLLEVRALDDSLESLFRELVR